MKLLILCGVLAAGLCVVTTGGARGGVAGSKHDFTSAAWSSGDLCGACHVPHRSERPAAAPLWDQDADLDRRFGRDVAGDGRLGLGTLMCIRCHDGTIAKDTLGGVRKERFINSVNPGLFTTAHGTSDHPVGVPYPRINRGYRPTNALAAAGVPLGGGNVQCSSCHDPHNQAGAAYMLVMGNARSALCLACHNK